MTKLKQLTLSNIRRFSTDVKIDISEGATVILAPNGTGKTSIFEAMEFCLTGKIKRLNHPPNPIIRDNYNHAKIRLDFDEDKFCQVDFRKDHSPELHIQHETLFGNADAENIPYLLRLTHLLNQSNKDWFVHTNAEEAASQLGNLPIGKDASIANSRMISAKRAATSLIEKFETELALANDRLKRWQALVKKRNVSISNLAENLSTKSDILKQIKQLVPDIFIDENDQVTERIKTKIEQGREIIRTKLTALRTLEQGLATQESVVISNADLMERKRVEHGNLSAKQTEIDNLHKSLNDGNALISKLNGELNEIIKQKLLWETQKNDIKRYETAKREKTTLETDKQSLRTSLEKNEGTLKAQQLKFDAENKLKKEFDAFVSKRNSINSRKVELTRKNQLFEDYIRILGLIEEITKNKIPNIAVQLEEITKKCLEANDALIEKNKARNAADSFLKNLTESSDTIKHAVSLIASALPKDQNYCPVCLENYPPFTLQERISKSLEEIDSQIAPAIRMMETAAGAAEKAQNEFQINEEKKIALDYDLNLMRKEVDFHHENISTKIFPSFTGRDIGSIREELNQAHALINNDEANLIKEEVLYEKVLSNSELQSLEKELLDVSNQVKSLTQKVASLDFDLKEKEKLLITLEEVISSIDEKEKLDAKISNAQRDHDTRSAQIVSVQNEYNSTNNAITHKKTEAIEIEKKLQVLQSRLDELAAQWLHLVGIKEINNQNLESAYAKNNKSITDLQKSDEILIGLQTQCIQWQSYDEQSKISIEIQEFIGSDLEEDVFTQSLESEVAKTHLKLTNAQNNNQVLKVFSSKLDRELKTINKTLNSITPLWSKILKRLIVDPRFGHTTMNNYQNFRKNYAEVTVPLHKSNTPVSHVASEAQITDLQFSFLLSMAQRFHWSPWRALLLDDPTQHHDLVHASAVFDVLRDYIADYNFQVVIATHDAVQAKYFVRKLANDGLPSKLYSLMATKDGVIAEQY